MKRHLQLPHNPLHHNASFNPCYTVLHPSTAVYRNSFAGLIMQPLSPVAAVGAIQVQPQMTPGSDLLARQ
jgi:hypothetical protein